MEKETQIFDIIRKIISNNPSKNDYVQLDNHVTNMVRNWLKKKADFDEETVFDLKQDVLTALLESFHKNTFWKEKLEVNDDNNNAIKSYVYKIIQSIHRKFNKDIIVNNDVINLKNLIQKSLKKLIEEKLIISNKFNKTEFYAFNNSAVKKLYDGYIDVRKLYILRQESKDSTGRLNGSAVKEAVIEILKNLENYWLTLSDILRILLENSDVNSFYLVYLDNHEESKENFNTVSEEIIEASSNNWLENIDTEKVVEIFNKEIGSHLRNKRKEDLHKICFYLYYKAGFTLREICEFIMMNYHIKLSLQTIKNYLSDMITMLNLKSHTDVGLDQIYIYLESFMNYIEKEYNLYDV